MLTFLPIVTVQVTCADIPGFLAASARSELQLQSVNPDGDLTVTLEIHSTDLPALRRISERMGASFKILNRRGVLLLLQRIQQRPVLLMGVLLLAALTLWLPTRVLFIEVQGNETVPGQLIVEKAGECGIGFGASRRNVRSEKMKNALLDAMPQLQWAGINTYGCRAVITVRERTDTQQQAPIHAVSCMVASHDGIIISATATEGNLLCQPGQVVFRGQVLISGYTDCGICIRATRAAGEIFAQTIRNLEVCVPTDFVHKPAQGSIFKKFSLLIGKKRINFFKDSGISTTTCDKMYREYVLTLPGGLSLPVKLAVTWFEYGRDPQKTDDPAAAAAAFKNTYLFDHMISGQILHSSATETWEDGVYILRSRCVCSEMIAQEHSEEITQ